MKNLTLFVVCILAFANNIHAQHNISGNIVDMKTAEGLFGVSVYITDLKTGTTTDFDGSYLLEDVKTGTYYIEVSYIGYKTINKKIHVEKDMKLDFQLVESVTELNQIVVTGMSRSTEKLRSPVIIKAVDNDILVQGASTNLIGGLESIPGINQITTGASVSKPVIRGLGFNRVLTLNNGIRQEGQQWGDEHGIEIDEYSVDRVEIIKGPGSLMYGSDGIAGVLNFLSPKPLPKGKVKTRIASNFQSNNRLIATSVSNAGNINGFHWNGRFTNKYAADYQNAYDGKVLNSGFKEFDGSLFMGINKKWGYSHLTLSSFNTQIGIVEGERDELGRFTYENAEGEEIAATEEQYKGYQIGFPNQWINHNSLASNTYFLLKNGSLNLDLGFQHNLRREYEDIGEPEDPDLALSLSTLTYNLRYNPANYRGWESSVGASGMYQFNRNKGDEFLIPDYTSLDVGAFLFTQKTLGRYTVAGGLRLDNRYLHSRELYLDEEENPVDGTYPGAEHKFSIIQRNYTGFSGSLGLSYKLDEISTLKFNVSRGFRAPNIAELASNGRHEGTFRYEIGTAGLKSENSNQLDLAYYLHSEHATLEITPFVNYIEDFIYIHKLESVNGGDSIPEVGSVAYQFTSGNALLYGGEIYLDFHPHPLDWLHVAQSFSVVNGNLINQPDSMQYLPSIPAPRYRGEVKAQFRKVNSWISDMYIKFAVDHYFTQNRIFSAYGTERKNPAYTLLSTGLGVTIRAFDRSDFLNVLISGENLTDVAYQNHLSRLKYAPRNPVTDRIGVYNMGRNVSVKVLVNI